MNTENHINSILEMIGSIQMNRLTVLTGGNGKGKSLIRKQMPFAVQKAFPNEIDDKKLPYVCKSVSMQLRTESAVDFGALSSAMHDLPWSPTSTETYNLIKRLFNICSKGTKYYYIIDEPEIGMSKESQLGITNYIKSEYEKYKDSMYGLLVITHSEMVVDILKDIADFKNLDGYKTIEDWKNREIIPTDFERLEEESHELFLAIQDRSKKV